MNSATNNLQKSFYRRRLPQPPAIAFSSPKGRDIFRRSLENGTMECFFPLAEQFRTQEDPSFCGLSTLAMVLNALGKDPGRVWKGPWRWFSEDMLNCCVPIEMVKKAGINFQELLCLARCNGALVTSFMAQDDSVSVEKFRQDVIECSQSADKYIIVSYSRRHFGQSGDGHFSPIGGYDAENDLILILDVARFKYPPHWVPLTLMFESMEKIDSSTQQSRGYMTLQNKGLSSIYFVISQSNRLDWSKLIRCLGTELSPIVRCIAQDISNHDKCLCCISEKSQTMLDLLSTYVVEFGINFVPPHMQDEVNLLLEQLRATDAFDRASKCKATAQLADRPLGVEIAAILLLALSEDVLKNSENAVSLLSADVGSGSDGLKLPEPLLNEVLAVRCQIGAVLSFCTSRSSACCG